MRWTHCFCGVGQVVGRLTFHLFAVLTKTAMQCYYFFFKETGGVAPYGQYKGIMKQKRKRRKLAKLYIGF
jgi:hypothetical protein